MSTDEYHVVSVSMSTPAVRMVCIFAGPETDDEGEYTGGVFAQYLPVVAVQASVVDMYMEARAGGPDLSYGPNVIPVLAAPGWQFAFREVAHDAVVVRRGGLTTAVALGEDFTDCFSLVVTPAWPPAEDEKRLREELESCEQYDDLLEKINKRKKAVKGEPHP